MAGFVLYVDVHDDLILDVDLVVDIDVDSKDMGYFSPQDILGGRWSKPRGANSSPIKKLRKSKKAQKI